MPCSSIYLAGEGAKTSSQSGLECQQNKQYLTRLLDILPTSVPWPILVVVLVSMAFVVSGFGIIIDSIIGVFPSELKFLRELFLISWFTCITFFTVSVYLSRRFYSCIYSYVDNQHFISNSDGKSELKRKIKWALDVGFGPIPLLSVLLLFIVRHLAMLFIVSVPIEYGVYAYWYAFADFIYSLFLLITFWSLILFSLILNYVSSRFPLRIRDVAEYTDVYEDISKLANTHIILSALTMGLFFFGISYWAFSMGTISYYATSLFLFVVAMMVVVFISWLNISGIHRGLEKSKKLKIASIRSGLQPADVKDLQISLHSEVSIWKIGPRMFESVLISLFVTELLTLLQYIGSALNELLGLF